VTADADVSGGAATLYVSPTPYSDTTGANAPYQNINVAPTMGTTSVNFVNATYNGSGAASNAISTLIGFHKDAFSFVSADLEMPNGVDFAARKVMDGISMRIVRDYDINNDTIPARIDVFYGYKTIRPELACRIIGN
jgi:P22 coat protein - gene protein 5